MSNSAIAGFFALGIFAAIIILAIQFAKSAGL